MILGPWDLWKEQRKGESKDKERQEERGGGEGHPGPRDLVTSRIPNGLKSPQKGSGALPLALQTSSC